MKPMRNGMAHFKREHLPLPGLPSVVRGADESVHEEPSDAAVALHRIECPGVARLADQKDEDASGGGSGNDLGNHTVSRLPSNPATEDRESKSAMYKEYSSKISQLVGLTQKSEAECRHMLEQKDFDVQRAINAFFNGEFLS